MITAAVLIIGNEILSGRTQDINTSWLGHELNLRGIQVREARVVSDNKQEIIDAIHALGAKYTYVFTTGGIGPTHDDITADAVAAAFNVALPENAEARRRLEEYYNDPAKLNEARLKMAKIPEGAKLIDNPISAAPGFNIQNIYVMAGIPSIMRAMFKSFADTLKGGAEIHSLSIKCEAGEGDLAAPLTEMQNKYPDVDIGSYPACDDNNFQYVRIVLRHSDPERLQRVHDETKEIISNIC